MGFLAVQESRFESPSRLPEATDRAHNSLTLPSQTPHFEGLLKLRFLHRLWGFDEGRNHLKSSSTSPLALISGAPIYRSQLACQHKMLCFCCLHLYR